MSARHPQIRQRKQRHQLRRVFYQSAKPHLGVTKLALDHPKGVFNLGPSFRFKCTPCLGFVERARLLGRTDSAPVKAGGG